MKVLQTTPPGKPAETSSVRERPILFSGEMVRAILAGRKTQTRRVAKFVPLDVGTNLGFSGVSPGHYFTGNPASGHVLYSRGRGGVWQQLTEPLHCPYGVPGDRLWVKETHAREMQLGTGATRVVYRASMREGYLPGWDQKWKPSIFMPRKLSRITLPITSIRVERLQDISEEDAKAEGVEQTNGHPIRGAFFGGGPSYREGLAQVWADINGGGTHDAFAANPWVWVVGWDKAVLHG